MPAIVRGVANFAFVTAFALVSCGKGDGVSDYPTPAYVSVDVWASGPPAKAEWNGAAVLSFALQVSGCSEASDNRAVELNANGSPQIVNLVEGDLGCVAALTSLNYGSETLSDVFEPEDDVALSGAVGGFKKYVGVDTKEVLIVTVEETLASPLTHNEVINFSVMPEKSENRLPAFVTSTSFSGTTPLPNVLISQIVDEGAAGSNAHALLVMVECLDTRALSMCGTQDLLDMRFWAGVAPAAEPVLSDVQTLSANTAALIIPREVELWRNGFRFNLMVAKNGDGTYASKMALMVRYGDSYRYMVLDVEKMLPELF